MRIGLLYTKNNCIFAPAKGKMQEWLNWPAWKASKRQKRFRGSNPLLSANRRRKRQNKFCSAVLLQFVVGWGATTVSTKRHRIFVCNTRYSTFIFSTGMADSTNRATVQQPSRRVRGRRNRRQADKCPTRFCRKRRLP